VSAKLLHPRCISSPAPPPISRMAPRTAPLHLRCAESSTPAGSPIAAINAHSGRGVVRPPRSFLAHRPLGRLFFRFAGRIACSSRQRPRCAQPLARRRMAAQRFCRLLTLSDLISAISAPVLRSVFGSAPSPLRGSWRQQPRGAAFSAAMFAPCAGDVLRPAVVMRKPVFICCLRGWDGGSCRSKTPPRCPHPPGCSALRIAKRSRIAAQPPANQQAGRSGAARRSASKNLATGGELLGAGG
jgi:hypothetical protein